jgi:hypothetical protein
VAIPIRGRQSDVQFCQVIPAKYLSGLKIRVSGVQFPPWPPKYPLFFLELHFELFLRRRQLCQDCAMDFQVVGVDREMPHG